MAAMEETGQNSYYLQDDLGSPMLLTDEQGQIRESYAFDEYGQALHPTPGAQLQPLGYTGYQLETTSGLYFAQARRYDAGTGRFVSEDKIPGFTTRPHTMNRYSYCWNQPMEHVDLNGRFPLGVVEFSNWVYIPITNDEGIAMHKMAMIIRYVPGRYNLWKHNCGQVAQIILRAGEKDFAKTKFAWWNTRPNSVYDNIVEEIERGNRPGWRYGAIEDLMLSESVQDNSSAEGE